MFQQFERWWRKTIGLPESDADVRADSRAGERSEEIDGPYRSMKPRDGAVIDACFESLREAIYDRLLRDRPVDRFGLLSTPSVFTERGRLESGRRYFYLKPGGESGWLFERTALGWSISRSEKIVQEGVFMRDGEPWDMVTLYRPKVLNASPRVRSLRAGDHLIGFSVYLSLMTEAVHSSAAAHTEVKHDVDSEE